MTTTTTGDAEPATDPGSRPRRLRPAQLIPIACMIGSLLLIGSELLSTFTIENLEGEAVELIGAAERHHLAFAVLGALGVVATVVALAAGSRPAAVVVAVAGLAALAIFAVSDLPDAGARDLVLDPSGDYVEGRAVAAGGFWISLIGGLVMTAGGILLATMSRAQLRALWPGYQR